MADELKGRVAIVTGGGRGIGKEIAEGLARSGAAVAITGRSASHLKETVAGIRGVGGSAIAIPADVSDEASVKNVVLETERQLGQVSILVNNAAVEGPLGPLWLNDTAAWRRCLDTNVWGPILMAQAVLPGMVERRFGHVINVASGGGLFPVPYDTGYSTTKAALIRLSEVMAIECQEFGVYVFSIHPGVVHTGMSDSVMDTPDGQKWMPGYAAAVERGATPIEKASQNLCLSRIGRGRRPHWTLPQRQRRLGRHGPPRRRHPCRRYVYASAPHHPWNAPTLRLRPAGGAERSLAISHQSSGISRSPVTHAPAF